MKTTKSSPATLTDIRALAVSLLWKISRVSGNSNATVTKQRKLLVTVDLQCRPKRELEQWRRRKERKKERKDRAEMVLGQLIHFHGTWELPPLCSHFCSLLFTVLHLVPFFVWISIVTYPKNKSQRWVFRCL